MECARENILLQKNIYYQLLCCQRIEYFLINYLKILEEKNLEFYIFSIDFFFRIQIDFFICIIMNAYYTGLTFYIEYLLFYLYFRCHRNT